MTYTFIDIYDGKKNLGGVKTINQKTKGINKVVKENGNSVSNQNKLKLMRKL